MKEILIVLAAVVVLVVGVPMFMFVKRVVELKMERKKLEKLLSNLAEKLGLEDAYTETRKSRVSAIAVRIARAMHLPKPEVEGIRIAALLHDIGKIGISAKILTRPAPLDPAEWSEMRRHPILGYEIVASMPISETVKLAIRHHHEHYDGSGYPDGLKGEDIPLGSRIILVAEAFGNITSDTPYRRARSKSEALRELKEHVGSQFDPEVVRVFESVIDSVAGGV